MGQNRAQGAAQQRKLQNGRGCEAPDRGEAPWLGGGPEQKRDCPGRPDRRKGARSSSLQVKTWVSGPSNTQEFSFLSLGPWGGGNCWQQSPYEGGCHGGVSVCNRISLSSEQQTRSQQQINATLKKGKKRENKVAASSQNWGKGSKREERD